MRNPVAFIFNPPFLQKLDTYLIENYPMIARSRIHVIAWTSLVPVAGLLKFGAAITPLSFPGFENLTLFPKLLWFLIIGRMLLYGNQIFFQSQEVILSKWTEYVKVGGLTLIAMGFYVFCGMWYQGWLHHEASKLVLAKAPLERFEQEQQLLPQFKPDSATVLWLDSDPLEIYRWFHYYLKPSEDFRAYLIPEPPEEAKVFGYISSYASIADGTIVQFDSLAHTNDTIIYSLGISEGDYAKMEERLEQRVFLASKSVSPTRFRIQAATKHPFYYLILLLGVPVFFMIMHLPRDTFTRRTSHVSLAYKYRYKKHSRWNKLDTWILEHYPGAWGAKLHELLLLLVIPLLVLILMLPPLFDLLFRLAGPMLENLLVVPISFFLPVVIAIWNLLIIRHKTQRAVFSLPLAKAVFPIIAIVLFIGFYSTLIVVLIDAGLVRNMGAGYANMNQDDLILTQLISSLFLVGIPAWLYLGYGSSSDSTLKGGVRNIVTAFWIFVSFSGGLLLTEEISLPVLRIITPALVFILPWLYGFGRESVSKSLVFDIGSSGYVFFFAFSRYLTISERDPAHDTAGYLGYLAILISFLLFFIPHSLVIYQMYHKQIGEPAKKP